MSEHSKPKTTFLMKLQPLKPMDRFKQPMQYSFDQKNQKTSEIKPNLPPIDFSSNPEIPVFMAPYEQYASQKNPDFFKINFERRLDRGNEEELRQLFMPKPPRKSRYCGICTEYYEEYYAHVTSDSHNAKFTKHPFLPQIYYEMEKVHGEFLKGRDKYVNEVPSSPEDSPRFSTNRKREYDLCISDSEHGGKGKSKDHHSLKDDGVDDNSKTRTARKEVYQAQKTTIKKDSKISLFDSRTQFSDNHEVLNKENKGGVIMHNNVRYSEDLFGNHAREDEIKCESPKNPIQRIMMKLKYDKKDAKQNNEMPKFLTFDRNEGRLVSTPENDNGGFPFTSWIPNNLEESKSSTTTHTLLRAENNDWNSGKFLKRKFERSTTTSEDEIIFCFKKVKLTDSQTPSQTAESETVKLDFNNRDKWKNLKSSVAGLFGDLKGTVSKIYDFWKKKDP